VSQVSPGGEVVKPSPPKPIERVFQHNGAKKMTLQDGPVTLLPYENKYARGRFSVRVTQSGQFVGLVQAGQEVACRKLLVSHIISALINRAKAGKVSCDILVEHAAKSSCATSEAFEMRLHWR
jgi:hypothetical protein